MVHARGLHTTYVQCYYRTLKPEIPAGIFQSHRRHKPGLFKFSTVADINLQTSSKKNETSDMFFRRDLLTLVLYLCANLACEFFPRVGNAASRTEVGSSDTDRGKWWEEERGRKEEREGGGDFYLAQVCVYLCRCIRMYT